MGSVTVAVIVDVILRDGLAPGGATLELDVMNVDTSVDNVHINALTARGVVLVAGESSETETLTVGDARKTLRDYINEQSRDKTGVERHTHGANFWVSRA